jgi:hypothetical protein
LNGSPAKRDVIDDPVRHGEAVENTLKDVSQEEKDQFMSMIVEFFGMLS